MALGKDESVSVGPSGSIGVGAHDAEVERNDNLYEA
jgi:hypothetical protein